MRFLGSKFTQNALADGALPRTPQTSCRFQGAASRQGKGKGGEKRKEGKGKGGIGEGKERGKGG